jgi:hypothetical protein
MRVLQSPCVAVGFCLDEMCKSCTKEFRTSVHTNLIVIIFVGDLNTRQTMTTHTDSKSYRPFRSDKHRVAQSSTE